MSKVLGIPALLTHPASSSALADLRLIHSQLPMPACVHRCQSRKSVATRAKPLPPAGDEFISSGGPVPDAKGRIVAYTQQADGKTSTERGCADANDQIVN